MSQLTEHMKTWEGEWTQIWECEPPPVGVTFRVLNEEWNDDYSVRVIRSVELT